MTNEKYGLAKLTRDVLTTPAGWIGMMALSIGLYAASHVHSDKKIRMQKASQAKIYNANVAGDSKADTWVQTNSGRYFHSIDGVLLDTENVRCKEKRP